jgi:Protein of unknown function (DUF3500)
MRSIKLALALAAFSIVVSIAYVAQEANVAGSSMVSAAQDFVGKLTGEQKKQGVFDFDSDERFRWEFIPLQTNDAPRKPLRKGIPIEDMTAEQKKAALGLLKAGTSDAGFLAATTIMDLEKILREQEGPKSAMVRNPEWYFFTVFGTPSKTGKWGWRVEGHHLSLNFTMDGTQVVASTPCFFGANPAEVKGGPNKGKRILPEAEDFARDLFKSLSDDQKKVAYMNKSFGEPGENSKAKGANEAFKARTKVPEVGKAVGVSAAKMTNEQKETLVKLLKSYTGRMAPDVGAQEMKQVMSGGVDNVHFAFTGAAEGSGKGYTYRVQGPTFVVEFLNIQADSAKNPANHIHSCWRRIKGDFGL